MNPMDKKCEFCELQLVVRKVTTRLKRVEERFLRHETRCCVKVRVFVNSNNDTARNVSF
jgi:hypothetical protein